MTIKLTKAQKIKILNTESISKIMRDILVRENDLDRNKEHCWVCSLDIHNNLLLIELISLGTTNKTIVEPVDVFAFALQKQAAKFILVHNHPSGEINPSPQDVEVTDRMQAIGRWLRVPMADHLIITEKRCFSFKDSGMLAKIVKKSSYDLDFKKIDKLMSTIQNFKVNSLKEKLALENEKIASVKQMTKDGFDINKISEYLGMPIEKVKELMDDQYI